MAGRKSTTRLYWEEAYLEGLHSLGKVTHAAASAGITTGPVYRRLKRSDAFRLAHDAALAAFAEKDAATVRNSEARPAANQWRRNFIDKLAETSNVTASASYASISTREVYRLRRDDPDFAAKWRAALFEGYEHLEMEMLAYLRGQQTETRLDTANAIRLLAAHRQTVAEIRAIREDDDEQAVLDSIDELIDRMRGATGPGKKGKRSHD